MDDDFGVAVRLENRAAMLELAAPVGGVCEIAVVTERHFALVAIDHDGLCVEKSFVARSGITRVADGGGAGKFVQNIGRENFFDFAHGAVGVEFVAVAGDNAGGFLAAMLERVETKIDKLCRFSVAEDSDDAAVVVEPIILICKFLRHRVTNVRSRELAQTSRRTSRGESMAACPLSSMRSAASRVTLPSSRAATLYCLAVARTAARLVGETETTQRAPRSLKRAYSAGADSLNEIEAPREEKADSSLRGLRSE